MKLYRNLTDTLLNSVGSPPGNITAHQCRSESVVTGRHINHAQGSSSKRKMKVLFWKYLLVATFAWSSFMLLIFMNMLIGHQQIGNITPKTTVIDNAIQETNTEVDSNTTLNKDTLHHIHNSSGLDDHIIMEQKRRHRILEEACKHLNVTGQSKADITHFIVNDEHKILFKFIAKVSCTTWKTVWDQLRRNNPRGKAVLNEYSKREREARLASYRKVIFVREPITRLLSAYLSKFRGGMVNDAATQRIYENTYGKDIIKRYRGKENQTLRGKWMNITFNEFVRYIIESENGVKMRLYNDHWLPQYITSTPCHIKYDFIGHFENIAEEGPYILRSLGIDHIVKFPEYQRSTAAESFEHFYKQLPLDLVQKLKQYFHKDFSLFGYLPDLIDQLV